MPCLALAEALRRRGRAAEFLTRAGGLTQRIRDDGFDVHEIPADVTLERDLEVTLEALAAAATETGLVLDGYAFTEDYQRCVTAAGHFLVFIDDMPRFRQRAHVVINHNLHATEADYSRENHTRLLLGRRYALLSEKFAAATPRPAASDSVSRILITMGGSDPTNATLRAMRAIESSGSDAFVRVVVGPCNPHHIAAAVADLAGDRETRDRMSRAGRALVDGHGAGRAAEALP